MKQSNFSVYTEEDDEWDNRPVIMRIQRKGVGIIDVEYTDEAMTMYCPRCKSAGFRVKLGPKILMPGEVKQPDYDQWLQCTDCFEVVPIFVVEDDAMLIKDEIPTVENPFENTSKIMGANPRRTTIAGQKAAARRKQNRMKLDDDPEIDALLKIYGDRVRVLK